MDISLSVDKVETFLYPEDTHSPSYQLKIAYSSSRILVSISLSRILLATSFASISYRRALKKGLFTHLNTYAESKHNYEMHRRSIPQT